MTATMNATALFQHYVQKVFKFPKEIKNDIVYCQRALKSHIKVHQMVLDVYQKNLNPDPMQKKRIIDELETQIYEINAEQQFLLLRLRRFIDDFYKHVTRKGASVIPELINDTISSEIVPLVNDKNLLIHPISVGLRYSQEKLIEKYFEVKTKKLDNYFEILDSDEEKEEEERKQIKNKMTVVQQPKSIQKSNHQSKPNSISLNTSKNINGNRHHQRQQSLLKPISNGSGNRNPTTMPISCNDTFMDASQFVEVMDGTAGNGNLKGFKAIPPMKRKLDCTNVYPVGIQASKFTITKECEDGNVPKNVKMSRMNLRQALKKAHTETLAAKSAEANSSQSLSSTSIQPSVSNVLLTKKIDQRARAGRAVSAVLPNVSKTIEVKSSSSGESTPERSSTPLRHTSSTMNPLEIVDTRLHPEDYGQEMFLRMFGLFTPEIHLQMQQRRSKRKRRTCQRNERADFHYERIEKYGSFPPPEDKRKNNAFLQSPKDKNVQAKRPKRGNADKSDESPSRSSSSSPNDKRGCNECLKGGGSLEQCNECKGFYHQRCHREADDLRNISLKPEPSATDVIKLCPTCSRHQTHIKKESDQYETLQTTAKKLEKQMDFESNRQTLLQQENDIFQLQMNSLYDIVKAIKSDPENNSD